MVIELQGSAWFDHRSDVPGWITSGIGQVAVEWSTLERELEELVRLLMDADIQVARILTNRMSASAKLSTATNLIQAHVLNEKLTSAHLNELIKIGKKIDPDLQTKRDMLSHGLWDKYKGDWCVLKLRQTRSTPELSPNLKKLSRAVVPQREVITREKLRSVAREIVTVAQSVESFCVYLQGALSPLQNTPPKYSRRRRDYLPTKRKKAL